MKKYTDFYDLDRDVDVLYEQKKYKEGLDVFVAGLEQLPEEQVKEQHFTIAWNKSVFYTTLNMFDECIELITETINNGYAFPISFKRFEPIMKELEVRGIVQKNKELLKELQNNAEALYEMYLPNGYDPEKEYPLFIALHGDGICGMDEFSNKWDHEVLLDRGYIVAYLQSSQITCYNGYGWCYDMEIGRRDIEKCYRDILKDHKVIVDETIIGGFSGGAIASMDFVLSNRVPIKGFVCLCPEDKTSAFTKENVVAARDRGVRGIFMEGEFVVPVKDEEEMMDTFKEVGLPYEFYILKNTSHNVPVNIGEKISSALDFINQ